MTEPPESARLPPERTKSIQQAGLDMEIARQRTASQGTSEGDDEDRVTPLELFFDLVFVFAITQVTQLLADRPTWAGLGQALILLALVWWSWALYAWLTNSIDTDRDWVRLVLFVAMMAMFVVALSLPSAFGDKGLLFAVAYSCIRVAHVVLLNDRVAVRALAPSAVVACTLVVGASFFDGAAQAAVFLVAVGLDFIGTGLRNIANWTLHPGYFAERHGLIIIVAFGESIVATGIGAADTDLGAGEIVAGSLAIAIAAAMWWAYFDVVALVAERQLRDAEPGRAQNALARDAYSYLHFVLIVAIVLVALASKKTIAHVDDPLKLVPAVALCGGVALYLLGHVALRLRTLASLNRQRLIAAVVAIALIPIAVEVPALVALLLVAVLMCGLVAYEAVRFRNTRGQVRARMTAFVR